MADYQRYQPRRSAAPASWRRWLIALIGAVIVILVIRALFSGRGETSNTNTDTTNTSDIGLINDASVNSNTAATVGVDGNVNTTDSNLNGNSNTNTSTSSEVAPPDFSKLAVGKQCGGAISQFGTAKQVALTFDMSSANEKAKQLVQLLQDNHIAASFFSSGTFAEKNKDILATVASAGFGIYNHGYDSSHFSTLEAADITLQLSKAATAIKNATGVSSKPLFRPAFGEAGGEVVTTAQSQGYCTILWTVDAFDWQDSVTADQSKQRVLDKLRSGAIILLHAGYDTTNLLVPDLVKAIQDQGYSLVTLATLLQP